MPKFRKKPVVVEAVRLTRSFSDVAFQFVGKQNVGNYNLGDFPEDICFISIRTTEGIMVAQEGDWIIKGVKGEFYPCKPDIFEATYEPVEESK